MKKTRMLTLMGLFIALCYIAFMFLKIPVPGTGAYVHLGNAICLLAVLVFSYLFGNIPKGYIKGGLIGGLCGALGMGIADVTSPGSLPWLPSTLILKFAFAMIAAALLACFVRTRMNEWVRTILACTAAMLFNFIAAPIANYLTNTLIVGADADASAIMAAWSSVPSGINAVVSLFAAPAIYMALRPALRRMTR